MRETIPKQETERGLEQQATPHRSRPVAPEEQNDQGLPGYVARFNCKLSDAESLQVNHKETGPSDHSCGPGFP